MSIVLVLVVGITITALVDVRVGRQALLTSAQRDLAVSLSTVRDMYDREVAELQANVAAVAETIRTPAEPRGMSRTRLIADLAAARRAHQLVALAVLSQDGRVISAVGESLNRVPLPLDASDLGLSPPPFLSVADGRLAQAAIAVVPDGDGPTHVLLGAFLVDDWLAYRLRNLVEHEVVLVLGDRLLGTTLAHPPADAPGVVDGELPQDTVTTDVAGAAALVRYAILGRDVDGVAVGIGLTEPEPIAAIEASVQRQRLIGFVILLLIVASLSWLLVQSLTRPLREVAARAKALTHRRPASLAGETGASSEAEDDEARVIGRAFDEMALQVEGLTSQEDDRRLFVAKAAHELRNPVAAIAGLSETLNTHLDRLTEDEEQGLVDSLLRQSRKLMRLSSVLLDLTQLEGGSARMEIEPLSLASAVAEVLTITPIPAGVALYREVEDDAVVLADEVRVQEIVVNLLTNAFRYGGPRVRIRTRVADGSWSLLVEDDGPGLSEDLVTRVFEPFVRGTSPAPGSSGLGLSIARATARAMGGELGYETCDRGARFVLTLPAALHALRQA